MSRWWILSALAAAALASGGCSGRDTGPAPSPVPAPGSPVPVATNESIQAAVDSHAAGTTFLLAAGTHPISAAITPKTGDTFIGEDGAVLDGTGWSSTDVNDAAFRAHNQHIDNVTIRNLTIQHMPQMGIHAFVDFSSGWLIEDCVITGNGNTAVQAGSDSVVRNNDIHRNAAGGYSAYRASNVLFDGNEIAYNGTEQKIVKAKNVTFSNNYVHDNDGAGIWYDTDNTGSIIENNRVINNGGEGIFYEISGQGVIRGNTVTGSGGSGIFISTSKDVEIYSNTLSGNFRAIEYFLNCGVVGGGAISYDLANDSAHDNSVSVPSTRGAFGNGLGYLSTCTSSQYGPYVKGRKALTFKNNHYTVPRVTGPWWIWGRNVLDWPSWQALPQDATGTVQ